MSAILVLGSTGQVGHALVAALGALPALGPVVALDRSFADHSRPEALREAMRAALREHRPWAVVNAAAYTAVDRAESEPELAQAVNAIAPRIIAAEAGAAGACTVHYSTDYVFDGRKAGPYAETDEPAPLSVYGRSKLDGERAVSSNCARHLTLRTSWVFSERGTNFARTMLRLAAERDSLRVVDDQQGAPTPASLVAEATAAALAALRDVPAGDPRWGTYHVTATGATSWHGFATRLLARAEEQGVPLRVRAADVVAIPTSEYPTPARRPLNSRLDTTRFTRTFGMALPHWTLGADRVVDQLTLAPR